MIKLNIDLLPCPFCGEPPRVVEDWDWEKSINGYLIACYNDDCGVEVYVFDYELDLAVATWNERKGAK